MKLQAIVIAAVCASAAAAPPPPTADAVLANVQHFYASTSHLTAKFRQVVTHATFGTSTTSAGRLWVAKPALIRWDYVAKSFVFDGKTLWLVDHVNKQIIRSAAQGSALPAAVAFLTGGPQLASQFTVALDPNNAHGALVLELTPKQASAQIQRLYFVVDPRDGHVHESIVVDANGDTNDITFYEPDVASAVPATSFQVNPASLPSYKLVVP